MEEITIGCMAVTGIKLRNNYGQGFSWRQPIPLPGTGGDRTSGKGWSSSLNRLTRYRIPTKPPDWLKLFDQWGIKITSWRVTTRSQIPASRPAESNLCHQKDSANLLQGFISCKAGRHRPTWIEFQEHLASFW